MTWFKVDDDWLMHPKVQAAGLQGRALWTAAGNQCAKVDSDGVVDGRMVPTYAVLAGLAASVTQRKAVKALVESGLWHDSTTIESCERCLENCGGLEPGDFFFHDWFEYQLAKAGKTDPIERDHELRRKRLNRNRSLCAAIRRRDRDICRYCGVHTVWRGDRKSPESGTYDHVDPFGPNTMANVVVACRRCNGDKRDRTPEQWGVELLPEPDAYLPPLVATKPDLAADLAARPDPGLENPDPIKPESGPPSRDARGGTDPDPGLVDQAPRPDRAGSGEAGDGDEDDDDPPAGGVPVPVGGGGGPGLAGPGAARVLARARALAAASAGGS